VLKAQRKYQQSVQSSTGVHRGAGDETLDKQFVCSKSCANEQEEGLGGVGCTRSKEPLTPWTRYVGLQHSAIPQGRSNHEASSSARQTASLRREEAKRVCT